MTDTTMTDRGPPKPPVEVTELPYGLWESPMAPAELFSQPSVPRYPFRHGGLLHWLEGLPEEGGRVALMRQSDAGARECLTPAKFNLRTAVHEYGGCCFCVLDGEIIFNNFRDGRIYRQALFPTAVPKSGPKSNSPKAVSLRSTSAQRTVGFADLVPLARHRAVIAVMETAESGQQNRDQLVVIDLSQETAKPIILAEGSDFYACPVVSTSESSIAWLEWDHPYMPWDQSRLMVGELVSRGGTLEIRNGRALIDQPGRAVCQPGFLDDQSLLFVSDSDTQPFWNFFRHRAGEIQQITDHAHEYGEAHWVFGQRRWQAMTPQAIAAVASDHAGDRLLEIALDSGTSAVLMEDLAACSELHAAHDANQSARELLFMAHYATRDAAICSLHWGAKTIRTVYGAADDAAGPAHPTSQPQPIVYPTRDGKQAYAYFYAPTNPNYTAPTNSKPPLLVVVHGGPTSRTTPVLHPLKQYFASLGYAVLDVNHRGSTGYGRAYRQSLLGEWGEVDATDIADGVNYVVAQKLVDPDLVFIRGGSAGGYAVLRALTRFPEIFSGGACYYGIGNLITLAQITHKFEGCYTDRLIGEKFDPDRARQPASRFTQRSPILQLETLSVSQAKKMAPLILFQGLDDEVVPPAVSREVAECLDKKGIRYEYIEYENEGHGFRRLPTRIDSLQRETAFFANIIRGVQSRAVTQK